MRKMLLSARLDKFIEKQANTGCWLWTGGLARGGYGKIKIREQGRTVMVHRLMWELLHGDIPPRPMMILHQCNVRNCCNPAHLYLGTNSENQKDRGVVGPGWVRDAGGRF